MNIENATAEELIKELSWLSYLGYEQYCLYPEGSAEQKQILKAQRVTSNLLNLLLDTEEDDFLKEHKDEILEFVKFELQQEQNNRLKELELSQTFLNGGIKCTIQA